jgi:isochorismate synthase/2-succinyl-5-enolpyruvyl-6-hydroxy-3-cyclohexene-1-carboxylate synthase/2-succinyl-6-hydroxy-2,4-cyclohexadiene-1-carboxylate synthase/O-succinylbenzoate synthase
MRSSFLVSNPPFLPSLIPRYSSRKSIRRSRERFSFPESLRVSLLHGIRRNIEVAQGVQFDGPIMDRDVNLDDDLVVQVCVTRTLPPALTLELGLESLKEAIDELKTNPPKSSSGVLRFQVLICFHILTCLVDVVSLFIYVFLNS